MSTNILHPGPHLFAVLKQWGDTFGSFAGLCNQNLMVIFSVLYTYLGPFQKSLKKKKEEEEGTSLSLSLSLSLSSLLCSLFLLLSPKPAHWSSYKTSVSFSVLMCLTFERKHEMGSLWLLSFIAGFHKGTILMGIFLWVDGFFPFFF